MADLSRRAFLKGVAASGVAVASGAMLARGAWASSTPSGSPTLWGQPGASDGVPADQLHIQYGADAATQMTVSWHTANAVSQPRLRLGTPAGGYGTEIGAQTVSYVDGINGVETIYHHVRLRNLAPGTTYVYEVLADGATPVQGTFRTAPVGRVPFRFTSVGDLATPNTAWSKSSLNAAITVAQVEAFDPLFHLHNGDLCYANVNWPSQPQVWADFMNNIQPAASRIPWMTAVGNHESEWGNGPLGYASYQTRFAPPLSGSANPQWQGNWYSFQVGSVFVVSLDANDVHYANDGSCSTNKGVVYDPDFTSPYVTSAPAAYGSSLYIHGYSGGAQSQWLEQTLAAAQADPSVDWIVAVFHQPIISSSWSGAGGDLGIRRGFLEAFDRYGVDLVLVGHDHDYERSYAVNGTDTDLLRPKVVGTDLSSVDSSQSTVHMVIGGGGTSSHDDDYGLNGLDAPTMDAGGGSGSEYMQAWVYQETDTVYKATASAWEAATWSAVRDTDTTHPWGMATFDVDPGRYPGDTTSITVNFWHTAASALVPAGTTASGQTLSTAWGTITVPDSEVYDSFTLSKPRKDGLGLTSPVRDRILVSR